MFYELKRFHIIGLGKRGNAKGKESLVALIWFYQIYWLILLKLQITSMTSFHLKHLHWVSSSDCTMMMSWDNFHEQFLFEIDTERMPRLSNQTQNKVVFIMH